MALVLLPELGAQLAWTDRTTPAAPPARRQHAMALREGHVVLFGGSGTSGLLRDTWEWDGTQWTQAQPALAPPARQEHAMAELPGVGTVLFGGFTGTSVGFLQDTWLWDGSSWRQHTAMPAPPARKGHSLTYDPTSRRVILFDGSDNLGPLGDTWAFDGAVWTPLQPATSPPPRAGHAAAFDTQLERIVLFGGFGTTTLADTWTFDGTTWLPAAPTTSPSPRASHAMCHDLARQRTVLFGGDSIIPGGSNDETWDFDGVTWTRRSLAGRPPARRDHALVYHPASGANVLFGGSTGTPGHVLLHDTWTLASTAPAAAVPFGYGCPGTGVAPHFLRAPHLPYLGSTAALEFAVVGGQPAAAFLGASRTSWGGVPLPIDLGFVGAPGCVVRISLDLGVPLAPTGTTARLLVPIPAFPGLVGASAFAQVASADPAGNPLGVVLSDAVELRVGWR